MKYLITVFITAPNRVPPLETDGEAADSTVGTYHLYSLQLL